MRLARFVRTLGFLLVLGLAGLGAGCGPSALSPADQVEAKKIIKESHKGTPKALKADVKKTQDEQRTQAAPRRGARRGGQ